MKKVRKKPNKKNIEEPERSKKFIVDNFTIEALLEIFGDQPEKGFVAYKDELPSLIGDMGAYKNGGGSDNETLLSLWNGAGVIKHRVGGNSIFTTTSHASILGGIQPDKLTKLLLSHGGGTDEQGFFARILMMNMRAKPHVLPEDHDEYSIAPFLTYAYGLVSRMEAIEFSFTPSAYEIYREYYNALEVRLHKENNPAMRAAIAKMEGYAARLAGIFHVLWEVASGQSEASSTGSTLISDEIPPERVASAIAWCEFCLNEMALVVTDSLAASGEKESINFKIIEYLKGKEHLSPGVVKNSIWTLRQKAASEIKKLLDDMTEMGLIERTGTGRNAK
ncbi:MAG: DUF3987 domain-containing protein, partial [Synechococcales cyanobacterium CRU_2_2]|nr:DUF3987 domain-containing protein [Synechococcales cyanobacterium CRU_2_2]